MNDLAWIERSINFLLSNKILFGPVLIAIGFMLFGFGLSFASKRPFFFGFFIVLTGLGIYGAGFALITL